jgi:protease-4
MLRGSGLLGLAGYFFHGIPGPQFISPQAFRRLQQGLPEDKVKSLIDQAPLLPDDAREQKLVDRLMYQDQIDEYIESVISEPVNRINAEHFYRLRLNSRLGMDFFRRLPRLALVYATGVIEAGDRDDFQDMEDNVNAEQMLKTLASIRENPRIKAAVLRIDSPGGSAVSSDLIWREVKLLSQSKPLIVSMADTAASGGYYLAMAGEKILAQPCTITGSIGVLAGKINLRGLYHKLGLKKSR